MVKAKSLNIAFFTYIDCHVFSVRASFALYWWTRCDEPIARPSNPTKYISNAMKVCSISETRKHSPSQEIATFYEILKFISVQKRLPLVRA